MAVLVDLTDEELVTRSVGGDTESFNQLIKRWEKPIYALAYRTIGREDDARDVVQETFLRAFRGLGGFKGQAKFSSWLYRIALNLCRDWMRRERRAPVVATPDGVDLVELAGEGEAAVRVDDLRRPQGPESRRRGRDARASRRAARGDRAEGVPRADVPGDRRPPGVPAEHREDPALPGDDGAQARTRQKRRPAVLSRDGPAQDAAG